MDKIIAKIDFVANGKPYIKGDIVEVDNIDAIRKLNENGFIEPLGYKDLVLIERELNKKKEEL